ncbi:hypothetical protein B0H14DRAFT_3775556 [Mycena olivaceomarginata]|nr:hypothetical protein B0H14DRAFT_3775556 [Mycena olivaceomarginata]
MPDPAPNSLAVGVIISMKNFDPGSSILSFDMAVFLAKLDDPDEAAGADAIPVCFFVTDPEGLSSPLILSMNYGNKRDVNSTSYNTTADGSISHFPFDIYSGSLVVGAQSFNLTTAARAHRFVQSLRIDALARIFTRVLLDFNVAERLVTFKVESGSYLVKRRIEPCFIFEADGSRSVHMSLSAASRPVVNTEKALAPTSSGDVSPSW